MSLFPEQHYRPLYQATAQSLTEMQLAHFRRYPCKTGIKDFVQHAKWNNVNIRLLLWRRDMTGQGKTWSEAYSHYPLQMKHINRSY